jgi:hypothetical protein
MKFNKEGELTVVKKRKTKKFCRVCGFRLKGEIALLTTHYEF